MSSLLNIQLIKIYGKTPKGIGRELTIDNRSDGNSYCPRSTVDIHNRKVKNAWALEDLIILDVQKSSEGVHLSYKNTSGEHWEQKPCTCSVELGTFIW